MHVRGSVISQVNVRLQIENKQIFFVVCDNLSFLATKMPNYKL